jgi:hypothetical protein
MNHTDLLNTIYYCPLTGVFTSKVSAGNRKAGSCVGNPDSKGYLKARILGENVRLNRLAWFYVQGTWPIGEVDHKNRVRNDNRFDNLRDCGGSANCLNQVGPRTNNTLGIRGVYQIPKTGRFRAKCTVAGRRHNLGVHATTAEAQQAYDTFKQNHLP